MEKTKNKSNLIAIIVASVLIVLLLPILIINMTLIIKGSADSSNPPAIFGIAPLAVNSGSMEGEKDDCFNKGALIFIKVLDENGVQQLNTGDVICYKVDGIYVTHRIISLTKSEETGKIVSLITMGDANNVADDEITPDMIFGICTGHIEGLGDFALFMQTPGGIILFIGVPVLLFIGYDVLRVYLQNKKQNGDEENKKRESELKDKDEEIRRLQEMLNAQNAQNAANNAQNENSAEIPPEE